MRISEHGSYALLERTIALCLVYFFLTITCFFSVPTCGNLKAAMPVLKTTPKVAHLDFLTQLMLEREIEIYPRCGEMEGAICAFLLADNQTLRVELRGEMANYEGEIALLKIVASKRSYAVHVGLHGGDLVIVIDPF